MGETYVSPGAEQDNHQDNEPPKEAQKFDLRNRLKGRNATNGARAGSSNTNSARAGLESPAKASASLDAAAAGEGSSLSAGGPPGNKDLKNRLGMRGTQAESQQAATEAVRIVPKKGRHFSGLVSAVEMNKPFCWVIPDSQPGLAGIKHYLSYEDLPYGFEVMKGTRVDYDLVPGSKKGSKKCGRIYVHPAGKAPEVQLPHDPEAAQPQGAAPTKKEPNKKANAKKQTDAKKLPLSTDPEEEARRERRAARFGMNYTPLQE